MRTIFTTLIVSLCLSLSVFAAQKEKPAYLDTSLDFETRTWDLVSRMTTDEKINQMMNWAPAIERLQIPQYDWWNECLHGVARNGYATVFPQAIGMAATFDTELMFKTADVISTEGRAKYHECVRKNERNIYQGLTFWSPNINIFRDPRWGRGQETYGEDPYLTGQMGMQFVKGLQGDDPKYFKLIATPKHYAVHNGPEPERHVFNAVTNKRDLYETYLPAFEDLIVKAKAYSIMGAYNRVDGESASASYMLLEDILRNKWNFQGYVVSDCGAIGDIWYNHKIVDTAAEAASLGARRGCDLNCGNTYKALEEALEKGYIVEEELDLNIFRLMLARMKLGMFDPQEIVKYSQTPISLNDCPAHDKVALQMAQEAIVLLKNKSNTLPLKKSKIKTIAIVGPNANSVDALVGNYNGDPSNPSTVLTGIKKALGTNAKVMYAVGCELAEGFVDSAKIDIIIPDFKTSRSPDAKNGLTAQYFNNTDLTGEPVFTRIEKSIDHNWQLLSPTQTEVAQGLIQKDKAVNNDNFSVRWTGTIKGHKDKSRKLVFGSDDGCRIYIDNKLVYEDWTSHAVNIDTIDLNLQPDKEYDIVIEYFEGLREAQIILGWETKKESSEFKLNKAIQIANQADAIIFVGGLNAKLEGEEMLVTLPGFKGGDRTDIALPKPQQDLLKAMHATGKPVVCVMLTGSAIACPWAQENIPAILCGWYPGQRGGDAIANVIFGDYNPAGRLPVTFYKSVEQLGDFRDYNMQGKTYRYFNDKPLYAFGYGLSYTTFEYSDLKVNKKTANKNSKIKLSFKLTNTGNVDGDEVVQLYIKDIESELAMPIKQLRRFDRIHLKAGESKTIKMTLTPSEDMRYYEPRLEKYTVEPGEFQIQIGASSDDIRLAKPILIK